MPDSSQNHTSTFKGLNAFKPPASNDYNFDYYKEHNNNRNTDKLTQNQKRYPLNHQQQVVEVHQFRTPMYPLPPQRYANGNNIFPKLITAAFDKGSSTADSEKMMTPPSLRNEDPRNATGRANSAYNSTMPLIPTSGGGMSLTESSSDAESKDNHEKTLNNDVKLLERIHKPVKNSSSRSNTGCLTCKSRKHKCDEHRPICIECARINMKCIYAPKGFVNLENAAEMNFESDDSQAEANSLSKKASIRKSKINANETFVDGIGQVKVLRAKVDHKIEDGKVVYRA